MCGCLSVHRDLKDSSASPRVSPIVTVVIIALANIQYSLSSTPGRLFKIFPLNPEARTALMLYVRESVLANLPST